jgi:hypothetical protein
MKKLFTLMVAAATVFTGCDKKTDNDDDGGKGKGAALSIDKTAIDAAYTAGTYTLQVTATQPWSAEVNAAATWCTISPTFYSGNHAVTVSVAAQSIPEQRAATITFTAGTLTRKVAVTQTGAPPELNTDTTAIDANFLAGTYSVAITSNSTWTATVNAAATWCTVSPATGTGNGTVTVNVTEQPIAMQRAATITFTAGTFTCAVIVTQAGVPATLTTDVTAINATYTAGAYAVTITSNSTWTATVPPAAAWCTIVPASGDGNGTVTVNVTENAAVTRAATITIAAGTLTRAVAVTQAGVLTIDISSIQAVSTAGTYTVAVTSNAAWTTDVSPASTWCTASPASGAGNGTITVNVAENPATVTRTATLTIAAATLSLVVTVSQAAYVPPPPHASNRTWTFGSQIWSDEIHTSPRDCAHTNKFSSSDGSRQYKHYGGHTYYSWYCAYDYRAQFCPSPWRIPNRSDLDKLIQNTTPQQLTDAWGLSGNARYEYIDYMGTRTRLWSLTWSEGYYHYALDFDAASSRIYSEANFLGLTVRCVR